MRKYVLGVVCIVMLMVAAVNGTRPNYVEGIDISSVNSVRMPVMRYLPVVYSGDFNGDGVRDLVVLSGSGESECDIYYGPFNLSEDSAMEPSVVITYMGPLWAKVYDYDGDGADELFLITVAPRSGVWMIRGGSSLPSVVTLSDPNEFDYGSVFVGHDGTYYGFSDVVVGDVTGDGINDIVIGSSYSSRHYSSGWCTDFVHVINGGSSGLMSGVHDVDTESQVVFYKPLTGRGGVLNVPRLVISKFNDDDTPDLIVYHRSEGTDRVIPGPVTDEGLVDIRNYEPIDLGVHQGIAKGISGILYASQPDIGKVYKKMSSAERYIGTGVLNESQWFDVYDNLLAVAGPNFTILWKMEGFEREGILVRIN
ncbi:hypothetical protein J7K41_02050, partial [Candidatus Micrarchaeota archaeon]|nr:hypothetical protein [Candidatus Micrarchaeota archaeon]